MANSANTSSGKKSQISEQSRSKSCDTVCSSNSSCILQKRKTVNPLAYSIRATYARPIVNSTSNVRQRVLSARMLKLRSLQSQLNDANYHLAELTKENQILKNLQKRQDKALSKYENTSADLPRLIHKHEEEIRILSEKNKVLRKTVKELNDVLKNRDEELLTVKEQLKHLEQLNKNKHLMEREKLMEQVEELKIKLDKSEEQVNVLNRKLMLENKSYKQRLNLEIVKNKQSQKQLAQAYEEIERLSGIIETKSHPQITSQSATELAPRKTRHHPRSSGITTRKGYNSMSLTSLNTNSQSLPTSLLPDRLGKSSLERVEDVVDESAPAAEELKLEPIVTKNASQEEIKLKEKKVNGILKKPSESIQKRLSSGGSSHSLRSNDSAKSGKSGKSTPRDSETVIRHVNRDFKGDEDDEDEAEQHGATRSIYTTVTRSNSLPKLATAKLPDTLDRAIRKATENAEHNFEDLGKMCTEAVKDMQVTGGRLLNQSASLKLAQEQTDQIRDALEETRSMERKLKEKLLSREEENVDFVNEILNEEFKFQLSLAEQGTKNRKVKDARVSLEEKKKLLATLRAIDNGEIFDSMDEPTTANHAPPGARLKEILGDR